MTGTKFLSEMVDASTFQKGKLNLIKAPTGCGKTYFALEHIPKFVNNQFYKVAFLIDTINGREQILKKYRAESVPSDWQRCVEEEMINFEQGKGIVVMTYAKFGLLCSRDASFLDNLEYIICDELHNLISFMKIPPRPNNCMIAKQGIEKAIRNGRTTVIGLTATPQKAELWLDCEINKIEIDDEQLIHYETKQIVHYNNLEEVFEKISKEEIGICYSRQIRGMQEVEKKALAAGLKPICIWSINNKDHIMTEAQLTARKEILDNSAIPQQYNLLIINSSSETSIKIKSAVDYVIVNTKEEDTQIQVRGRVNHDLERLYLPTDKLYCLDIGEEYLDRKLFDKEKEELCAKLHIYRKGKKEIYKWNGIKNLLPQFGYAVEDGRYQNKRFSIITKEE